jgi:hypothetical protein
MPGIRTGLTLAVVALALAGAAPASAGWVIEQAVKGQGEAVRVQIVMQSNRMKTVHLGPSGAPLVAFILDLDAQTIAQIDYEGRQYAAGTVQEYVQVTQRARQQTSGQAAAALEQMKGQLEQLPPEQRRQIEAMLRQQAAGREECREPKIETRRTGQQATVAGYRAVRFDVLADGAPQSEVWIARDLTAWRELDRQKLERLSREMARAGGCGAQSGRLGGDPSWHLAGEGYPVRIVGSGGGRETIEVVKAESKSVPATEFQPPAGFTRKPLLGPAGQ